MARKSKEADKEYQEKYYQEHKNKRQTHTSTAVKSKYNKKTYKNYNINFRIVDDAEIIALIEGEKSKGFGTTEAIKNLILRNSK